MKNIFIALLIIMLTCSLSVAQGEWTHITEINGNELGEITGLKILESGNVWISSRKYDPMNSTIKDYVFLYDGHDWLDKSEYFDSVVLDIDTVSNGSIWFVINPGYLINYDGIEYIQIGDAPFPIQDISVDEENNVWCSTDHGVLKYNGYTWTIYTTEEGLVQNGVTHIVVSPDGVPWVRYGDPYTTEGQFFGGISYFNVESWITNNESTGLPSNRVDDIAFGNDDSVYISYAPAHISSGISRYDGIAWEQITEKSGKLYFDSNDILWVIDKTDGHYVSKYDGTTWIDYHSDSPAFMSGNADIDTEGRVWIGSNDGILILDPSSTAVEEEDEPQAIPLLQNYPNPFNAKTTISFSLQNAAYTTLDVYNITGQNVATLVDEQMVAGNHAVVFDGSDLGSGMYFYRFSASDLTQTGKMLLIK